MTTNEETYPKQIVNYRLVTEIDAGGSGTVYLAEHMILTERKVAIKLLHTHLTTSEDRGRFLDEAKVVNIDIKLLMFWELSCQGHFLSFGFSSQFLEN